MALAGLLTGLCDIVRSATIVARTSSPADRASVAELFDGFKKLPPFAEREMEAGLNVFADEGAIKVEDASLRDSDSDPACGLEALVELLGPMLMEAVVPEEVDGADASTFCASPDRGLTAAAVTGFELLCMRPGEVMRGEAEVEAAGC